MLSLIKKIIIKLKQPVVWLRKYKRFLNSYQYFNKIAKDTKQRFDLRWEDKYPCLDDATGNTGFDRHYIYHTAWAARVLSGTKPTKHIDISSYLYFSTLVSAFLSVEFYDYRPAPMELSNLVTGRADLLNLPFVSESVESLSCMHVIEHIGLGRYGDPFDYDGDIKAVNELKRVIKPDGNLLIVLPLGKKDKICYNAHRIYTFNHVMELFSNDFKLTEFAFIEEFGDRGLLINPNLKIIEENDYGCGCFLFTKK